MVLVKKRLFSKSLGWGGILNMEQKNSHLVGDELIEVGFAREFQDAVIGSKVLDFENEELKRKVLMANSNQLLIITSTINSPKRIKTVEYYNDELIASSL